MVKYLFLVWVFWLDNVNESHIKDTPQINFMWRDNFIQCEKLSYRIGKMEQNKVWGEFIGDLYRAVFYIIWNRTQRCLVC